MKVPFHTQIDVTKTFGRLGPAGAVNAEIRSIQIKFEVVRQSIVKFEVGGILAEIWELGGLQGIDFVKKLKVQNFLLGNSGVIGIERQLSEQWVRFEEQKKE